MRILFAGSPEIAVPSLEAVFKLAGEGAGFEIAGALTNPDTAKGRKARPEPTEVGAAAERLGLPAIKAGKLGAEAREAVAALKPDILVSFAYSRIFGPKFLALFPLGGINVHPSLLPKYRGASPIQAAILNRDAETGISVQRLALEMDCGNVLVQERIRLDGRETTASLSAAVAEKAAPLLVKALRGIKDGGVAEMPQDNAAASLCSIIAKEEGSIDWNQDALAIDARIRAFTPWPLSWTTHRHEKLFILEARPFSGAGGAAQAGDGMAQAASAGTVLGTDKQAGILIQTGKGVLAAAKLQYQAKKALGWRDFLNGARDITGDILGDREDEEGGKI